MAEHNSLGSWGEQVVVDHLIANGYAIVERNWRLYHLEIDIIASLGDEIAFIEVKTRRDTTANPLQAITKAKINNMVKAANTYIRFAKVPLRPRFDIATITGDPNAFELNYIANAFLPPLRTYR